MTDKQWIDLLFKIVLAADPEGGAKLKEMYDAQH
jgi:hypothetical protein